MTTTTESRTGELVAVTGDVRRTIPGVVIIDPSSGLPVLPSGSSGPSGSPTDVSSLNKEVTQAAVKAALDTLNTSVAKDSTVSSVGAAVGSLQGVVSLEATQAAVKAAVQSIDSKTPALSGGAVPVSVSGVATSAKQDALAAVVATAAKQDSILAVASTSAKQDTLNTSVGAQADAAATADTGAFSLHARIQRALQNWTTFLAKIPASLGAKLSAASFSVVLASDHSAVSVLPTSSRSSSTLTIPNAGSVSPALDCQNSSSIVGITLPAAWTTAALSVEASPDNVTWFPLYDASGSAVSFATPVVSSAYSLDPATMLPWRYIRFRSGTSASPVNQAADRVIGVITRPLA